MAGASPLPTLEGDRFQSQYIKRDGIDILSFNVVLERVVIFVGGVEWTGVVFDDFGSRGLFLQGQHWGDVDLRKGYLPPVFWLTLGWLLFWILLRIVWVVHN
jgi:hypothetical protein